MAIPLMELPERDVCTRPGTDCGVLPPGASVVLRCAVHLAPNAPTPVTVLERSQLQEVVSLGADLDIDLYVMEDDEP